MKETLKKFYARLRKNGSPVFAFILFFAAFGITVLAFNSCTTEEIDRFELGQSVRQIVDGEKGDAVVTINDVDYYEQDLLLMRETIRMTEPNYSTLKDEHIRMLAGEALIKQKILLSEFERLGLTIEEGEFEAFLQKQKDEAYAAVLKDDENAKLLTDYIAGYGCTFSEYWEDEYVIESYKENLKLNKLNDFLAAKEGTSKITNVYLETYITDLIHDETYKVTLFGEKFY